MTMQEQMEYYIAGRDYWQEYVNVNGYAWCPNEKGLKALSKNLDLKVSYLRKIIHDYLNVQERYEN